MGFIDSLLVGCVILAACAYLLHLGVKKRQRGGGCGSGGSSCGDQCRQALVKKD